MACVCFYLEACLRNVFGGWVQNKHNYLSLEAAILWHIQCQQKSSGRMVLWEWTWLFFWLTLWRIVFMLTCKLWKCDFLQFAFYFVNISEDLKGA